VSRYNNIENNTFFKNSVGIEISKGTYAVAKGNIIRNNNIIHNSNYGIAVFDNDDYHVTANDNWWGDPTGPYHEVDNTGGRGDNVTDLVDFEPWLEKRVDLPPVAHINSISPNPAHEDERVHFQGQGSGNGSILHVWRSSVDGVFFNSTVGEFDYLGLSPGEHTIYLKVRDESGRWSHEIVSSLLIKARTLTVDDNGQADFARIQDAINASSDGDTIMVFAGIYFENLVVDKRINLTGESRETTLLDGRRKGNVIEIKADWVNISGFKIIGSNSFHTRAGIYVVSDNNSLFENNCSENYNGIYCTSSSNNSIFNNICSNNNVGIYIGYYSDFNVLYGNTLSDNKLGFEIHYYSQFNTFNNNVLSENKNHAIYLYFHANENSFRNNKLSESLNGFFLSKYCNNNTFYKNHVQNSKRGCYLDIQSNHNTFFGNDFSNNNDGIYLSNSDHTCITNNTIIFSEKGVVLEDSSSDNRINNNNIVDSTFYGIDASENGGYYVFAINNWWGDSSGPYHPANNSDGKGDAVTDYVEFSPWLNEPIGELIDILPIANAGEDKMVLVDEEVEFVGVGDDFDGEIVNYEWDFDGDGLYDWESTLTGETTRVYTKKGTYHAGLRVTDNDGRTATDIRVITVREPGSNPPTIHLSSPSNIATIDSTTLTISWNGNDIDGDHLTYDIYLGTIPTPGTMIATGQADEHYALSGLKDGETYYWQVVVDDGESETASEIWSFTVSLPSTTSVVNDGDSIKVHYIGYLMDGTLFDASFSHLQESTLPKSGNFRTSNPSLPLSFTANGGEMIQGFDEGVLGLELGELATIIIPPEKAYQDPGIELYNKTLMFDVLVVEIEGESVVWEDVDSDGDGFPDDMDWAPSNRDEWWDHDGDGVGDNADDDDDNDGFVDSVELQFGSNPFDVSSIPHVPSIMPTVMILSPTNNEAVSGVVTISGAAFNGSGNNRTIEKVEISINGGSWMAVAGTDSWTYEWDTTNVAKGEHEIRVQAYDGEEYSKIVTLNLRIVDSETPGEDVDEADDEVGFLPGFEVLGVVFGIFCGVLWRRKNL